MPKSHRLDLELESEYSFDGKKRIIRAHLDRTQPNNDEASHKSIVQHLLEIFFKAEPASYYRWGPQSDYEAFFFELLDKCFRLGLVPQLRAALRHASPRIGTLLVGQAHVRLSELGLNSLLPW